MITVETYTGNIYASCIAALRQHIMRWRERNGGEDPLHVRVHAPTQRDVYVDVLIRMSDVYVIGVENRACAFYFNDSNMIKHHSDQRILSFSGEYGNLGRYKDIKPLSVHSINNAIHIIAKWTKDGAISNRSLPGSDGSRKPTEHADSLLILVLLTSEAARFRRIWTTIAKTLDGNPSPLLTMEEIDRLVRDWKDLSKSPHWYLELDLPSQ